MARRPPSQTPTPALPAPVRPARVSLKPILPEPRVPKRSVMSLLPRMSRARVGLAAGLASGQRSTVGRTTSPRPGLASLLDRSRRASQ